MNTVAKKVIAASVLCFITTHSMGIFAPPEIGHQDESAEPDKVEEVFNKPEDDSNNVEAVGDTKKTPEIEFVPEEEAELLTFTCPSIRTITFKLNKKKQRLEALAEDTSANVPRAFKEALFVAESAYGSEDDEFDLGESQTVNAKPWV